MGKVKSQKTVCVVGSGGREHALADVLSRHATVIVTPGNPGIPGSVSTSPEAIDADLYVIGPEQPLVDGLADRLRTMGKLVFGPGADGAQLEGSKEWMKRLLDDASVRTAPWELATNEAQARAGMLKLQANGSPGWAIKTDGLAAGKGVYVTTDIEAGVRDVADKLGGKYGNAGKRLVIEGMLRNSDGTPCIERSIIAVCNGTDYALFEGAQDYKPVQAGSSLNTGGMGAYSPTFDQAKFAAWGELCIRPVLEELKRRGIDYRGVLYCGIMLVDGQPVVLEFNNRFGDPETQVILPRLDSDLVELLSQAAAGEPMTPPVFSPDVMINTVHAAENYPGDPRKGDIISGIDEALAVPGTTVYCAGVSEDADGNLITAGGRVINVVARAKTAEAAIEQLDLANSKINWPGRHSRDDIGQELLSA